MLRIFAILLVALIMPAVAQPDVRSSPPVQERSAPPTSQEMPNLMSTEDFLNTILEPYCACGIGSCGAYNRDTRSNCASTRRLCNKCSSLTCELSRSCS